MLVDQYERIGHRSNARGNNLPREWYLTAVEGS